KGLLVMGPDCGTALIGGIGLGFANRVRRGRIGIVGASGTGIQAVSVGIHQRGAGISHAIGTGSRDLSDAVGAVTTLQALDFLARDSDTAAMVLISKPPSPKVAARVLDAARRAGKPVVVDFIGYRAKDEDNLHFARTLDHTAEIAVALSKGEGETRRGGAKILPAPLLPRSHSGFLRGLYSGGTLAYEAQLILREYIANVFSNAPLITNYQLPSPNVSREHTIIDLGAEEFMVGRLHPMIDNDLRLRRLRQEADDASVAIILLDVVLGYGAHPDPARELAPAIAEAIQRGKKIIAVVIGTEDDPQNYARQVEQLRDAGARVFESHEEAVRFAGESVVQSPESKIQSPESGVTSPKSQAPSRRSQAPSPMSQTTPDSDPRTPDTGQPDFVVEPASFKNFAALNVGLESFFDSLIAQRAPVIHVDWRPPAGGNERMMEILAKLKSKQ
ncbi:MAG: protein FdrA, partial [Chloroflexi bacterium]|nr:protein FdrA [Chloroflexota bacterium]